MTRKDFFLGLILGLIVFSFLFIGYAQGQNKPKPKQIDTNYVWIKVIDLKQFFQNQLEAENIRFKFVMDSIALQHAKTVSFIQSRIILCDGFADSVKVKK